MSVKSFSDINKLPIKVKPHIQITRAGGHYRARYRGRAECTFGATAAEALARLTSTNPRFASSAGGPGALYIKGDIGGPQRKRWRRS